MILITGDTHREFDRLLNLDISSDDLVIILGDVGINYYTGYEDNLLKHNLNDNYKLFCIQGNHEERPENIGSYKLAKMYGGKVFVEDEYPNLIFAKNGEEYRIAGKSVLVIGGAYSVDKNYRLANGYNWFENEQLSPLEMDLIYKKCKGKHFDAVLTHTCPKKYIPTEMFLEGIDQSTVDNTMEEFLDKIEESITYDKWYCGHYHTDKQVEKLEFMFKNVKYFNEDEIFDKKIERLGFLGKSYQRKGYDVFPDYFSRNECMNKERVSCPKCGNTTVLIQKGNGNLINGTDLVGLVCDNCKSVFGFNDVNYFYPEDKEI